MGESQKNLYIASIQSFIYQSVHIMKSYCDGLQHTSNSYMVFSLVFSLVCIGYVIFLNV